MKAGRRGGKTGWCMLGGKEGRKGDRAGGSEG